MKKFRTRIVRYRADRRNKMHAKGAALLVVLFIVMTITIISLGFVSRSDVELACGQNMLLRTQVDYLAESGLEHAKGLILNPQDIGSEYWAGAQGQQLVADSDSYYDVDVVKLQECYYRITCDAYREKDGEKTGRSILEAQLKLYPCVALWTNSSTAMLGSVTIEGDIYCSDTFSSTGIVNGDVFANILIGTINGRKRSAEDLSLNWPDVIVEDYISRYPVVTIDSNDLSDIALGPYEPARVCYYDGDLTVAGAVQINGMLIVNGNLAIKGSGNVITSSKNLPAVLVNGNVAIGNGAELIVSGLVVVYGGVNIDGAADIVGGVFAQNDIVGGGSLSITASGSKAAIVIWSEAGDAQNWSPAAGAYYRSIERK